MSPLLRRKRKINWSRVKVEKATREATSATALNVKLSTRCSLLSVITVEETHKMKRNVWQIWRIAQLNIKKRNRKRLPAELSGRTGRRLKRCSIRRPALTTTSGMSSKVQRVNTQMKSLSYPKTTLPSKLWNKTSLKEDSVVDVIRSRPLSSRPEEMIWWNVDCTRQLTNAILKVLNYAVTTSFFTLTVL